MRRLLLLVLAAAVSSCASPSAPAAATEDLTASPEATITASDGAMSDQFGNAVAMSADAQRAVVGVRLDDSTLATNGGGFSMFVRSGTTWAREAQLVGSQGNAELGYAVAMDATGTRVVAGARWADLPGGLSDAGTAYVYVRSGSTWTYEATLTPAAGMDAPAAGDEFGYSVSIDGAGTRIVVGARRDDTTRGSDSGSARIFVRSGSTWTEERVLVSASLEPNDEFGSDVALSTDGSTLLVGAPADAVPQPPGPSLQFVGAAYVFARSGSTWTQQAELRHEPLGAGDFFGLAVALTADGSRAIVGAPRDNVSFDDDGSATIFVRTGSSWSREASLVALGAEGTDRFGWDVDISADGGRAIVGVAEDSTASAVDVGSARIFVRSGTRWTEERTILAADGEASDFLGQAVAMSDDGTRCAVGVPTDDTTRATNAGSVRVLTLATSPVGAACGGDAACTSGFCVDGVCCSARCDGSGQCQGCSAARTGLPDGTCGPLTAVAAAATVCRPSPSTAPCGLPETCTPGVVACPADLHRSAGVVFRPSVDLCDATEVCAGDSEACPADGPATVGTVCRAPVSACDTAEACTGTSMVCPDDVLAPFGTICRSSGGACDVAEACNGTADCPPDDVLSAGTECRGRRDVCDAVESCDGVSAACPPDGFLPSTVTCRPAESGCDVPELCTGTTYTCPLDLFASPSLVCRAASGDACDAPDHCSGTSADCVETFLSGVPCREPTGACDLAEVCSGSSALCPPDLRTAAGVSCRPSTSPECDPAELCDGVGASCPGDETSCIETDAGAPAADAAVSAPDAGRPDEVDASASTLDAGAVPPVAAGCTCRVGNARSELEASFALLAVLLVLRVRARPRRRAAGSRTP